MTLYTAEDVITALYWASLGRAPDPVGLEHYRRLLTDQPGTLLGVSANLFESEEHRSCLNHKPAIIDHSQFREFTMLLQQYVGASKRHGIVIDVGARGRERSNSYDLLTNFGWRGLLIEANPELHDDIQREFAETNITLLTLAIGTEEGVMPFHIGVNDDVSSLMQQNAAEWGKLRGEIQVEVKRLGSVLEQHSIPHDFDLLSLDIEGLDVPVLNDLIDTTDYRPLTIIIEASDGFRTKALGDVGGSALVQRDYVITGQTDANLILGYRP